MDTTFMTTVYFFIDDWLKDKRICQRGQRPRLSDSEVLTIEVIGEFLGNDDECRSSGTSAAIEQRGFRDCER